MSHEFENTNPQTPEQQFAALRVENEQLRLQNDALNQEVGRLQNEVRQELAAMAEGLHAIGSRLDALVERLGRTTVIANLPNDEQSHEAGAQASADADASSTATAAASASASATAASRARATSDSDATSASRSRASSSQSSAQSSAASTADTQEHEIDDGSGLDSSSRRGRENWFKRNAAKLAIGAAAVAASFGIVFAVGKNVDDKDKTPNVLSGEIPAKYQNEQPTKSGNPSNPRGGDKDKTVFPSDRALRGASLNEAAKLIKSGSVADAKANVRKIAESPEISVSHAYNQQAHAAVNKEAITLPTAIEMVALSRHSDDGNVVTTYNNLHDRPLTSELPTSVSEARAWILNKMADDGTNYRLVKMSIPNSENAGQRSERDVFSVRQNFSNVLFLEMTLENGNKALFKVGGGSDQSIGTCWNDVQGNPASVREFIGSTTSPSQGNRTSTTTSTGGGSDIPVNPAKPNKTTTTDQTGGKRVVKVSPKTDDGRLPGNKNVPADQDKGTPDKPGKGPAGQTPDQSGYVPGESRPATPAPEPTPAPLPNQPAPTGPAQEGTPTPAPAQPANGSETPAPTSDPNPQG